MAAQNGFTPVDIWINYNHSSTVSTIIYEEVTAEILDNLSGPDVVPGTVSVGTDITELESGNGEKTVCLLCVWRLTVTGIFFSRTI